MKTINELAVRATYSVTCTNIEVPDAVYDQLINYLGEDPIDDLSSDATEAYDWLVEHINEADAMDWQVEVITFE